MFNTVNWIQIWRVTKRLFRNSFLAILIAVLYTFSAVDSQPNINWTFQLILKEFLLAFFFLMWFVSLWIRTTKELTDSTNYSTLQTGLVEIKEAITNLQSQPPANIQTGHKGTKNDLMLGARQAVDRGFVLAGLLQAGVTFEQSIIAKAEQLGIQKTNNHVANIIKQLRDYYDHGTVQEFFNIWKLRNTLVHLTPEAAIELNKSPQLIKYFEWAVSRLEEEPKLK
jgi:hypothetical protein